MSDIDVFLEHDNADYLSCDLCGLRKNPRDHDGHGLGECVDVCGMCMGSGGEKEDGTNEDPCPNCNGTGGVPFAESTP